MQYSSCICQRPRYVFEIVRTVLEEMPTKYATWLMVNRLPMLSVILVRIASVVAVQGAPDVASRSVWSF